MVINSPQVSPAGRYSVRQAAQVLGVCENTVRNWLNGHEFLKSEYNHRGVGRRATYITGLGLIRVWNSKDK